MLLVLLPGTVVEELGAPQGARRIRREVDQQPQSGCRDCSVFQAGSEVTARVVHDGRLDR